MPQSRFKNTSRTTLDAIDATTSPRTTRRRTLLLVKNLPDSKDELPALLGDGHVVRRFEQISKRHLVVVVPRAWFVWYVGMLIKRPARPEPFGGDDHDPLAIRLDVVVVGEVE